MSMPRHFLVQNPLQSAPVQLATTVVGPIGLMTYGQYGVMEHSWFPNCRTFQPNPHGVSRNDLQPGIGACQQIFAEYGLAPYRWLILTSLMYC